MTEGQLAGWPGAWRVLGEGPRAALALHCSLGHAGAWSGLAAALGADRARLVAMDLPGHGRAGPIVEPRRYLEQATRMAADLAARAGAPLPVIGHSFGAVVATRLALDAPELVERLVLVEPVLMNFMAEAQHPGLATYEALEAPFWQAWARGDREAAARAFLSTWGAGPAWEDQPARQRQYVIERIGVIDAAKQSMVDNPETAIHLDDLARISCPVLLVHGEETPQVIVDILDIAQPRLSDAGRVVIPGAHHMAPITHPQATAAAIAPFMGLELSRAAQ